MGRRKGTAGTAATAQGKMVLRKKGPTVSCATQTSPELHLKPIVVLSKLKRIPIPSERDREASEEHEDEERTYHQFARSIRNNHNVNSTVFDGSPGGEKLKPGPLSYKRRMLQRIHTIDESDQPIVVRSSAEATSSDCVAFQQQEIPSTPLQDSANATAFHDPVTVEGAVSIQDQSNALNSVMESRNPNSDDNNRNGIDNVRFRFGEVTVNVSPRSYEENREKAEQTNNTNDRFGNGPRNKGSDDDKRRHIRINAHTVHIHNHFYKT